MTAQGGDDHLTGRSKSGDWGLERDSKREGGKNRDVVTGDDLGTVLIGKLLHLL
jgi:hypothetical protein